MIYQIRVDHWEPPNADTTGYIAWAYLPGLDPFHRYETRTKAEQAIESAHTGPDKNGVFPVFKVIERS